MEHVISAVAADAETAALLMLKPGDPCLLLDRRTWSGTAVATVNRLVYAGHRYSLGSRYTPLTRRMSSDGPPSRAGGAIGPTAALIGNRFWLRRRFSC